MGRKKWWFPPLENKKKPGPNEVVTIDGEEEDFDTVMGREVAANHELRDRLITKLSIDVIDGFTDLIPDGNGGYTAEPSPQLAEMYPGLTLEEMKVSLEVKLEYGIDQEPVPPQVSEEQEEEQAMTGIQKIPKRVKTSMWGPDAVFKCDQCPKSFSSVDSLRKHRHTHINDPDKYQCNVCGKNCRNSVALTSHRRYHVNDPDKYQCKLCGKKCRHSLALASHRQTHVNNPEKYACPVCTKKFRNSKALASHRQTHVNNPEKYACPVCKKKCSNYNALSSHRKSHVNNPEKYTCQVCGKKFPNYKPLYNHRQTHLNQRSSYECFSCMKVFKNAQGLAHHQQTHRQKDKNVPKHPQSAFFLWMKANREQMKTKYTNLNATEFRKNTGELWNRKIKWNGKINTKRRRRSTQTS